MYCRQCCAACLAGTAVVCTECYNGKQNIGNIVPKEWPKATALKSVFTKVVWKVDKELHSCKLLVFIVETWTVLRKVNSTGMFKWCGW